MKQIKFEFQAMNRRFLHEVSSSSVSSLNGITFGGNTADQTMNTGVLFYNNGFENDDDCCMSDCSTSCSYSSDLEGLYGTNHNF